MNELDRTLQNTVPVIMVPKFEPFMPLLEPGHRFLATEGGLWLEAVRKWCYVRMPVAPQPYVSMPYGSVEMDIHFKFPGIPKNLLDEFEAYADKQCPNECASWIVWSELSDEFSLVKLSEREATPKRVCVNRPPLEDHEHLVVDLHSHGYADAFFSSDDNADDVHELKIAGVLGNLNDKPTWVFRLCVLGFFLSLPTSHERKGTAWAL